MEGMKDKQIGIKKFLFKAIILILITLGPILLFNYIVDPLQFYKKSTILKPIFSKDQRLQNPGLAKNYDYNTIILGTSMTENFLPSSVDSKLGVKSLKLSVEGSSIKEQNMVFDVAARTGKLENVIWEVDYFSLMNKSDINKGNDEYEFPIHLYDKWIINDIKYLASNETLKYSLNVIKYNQGKYNPVGRTDLEYLNNWGQKHTYSEERVLEDWNRITENMVISDVDNWDMMRENINEFLINSIEENRDVKFLLYYPPFTDLLPKYLHMRNVNDYNNFIKVREYIFNRTQDFDNVEIYDFQDCTEITSNYNNYKDVSHHSPEVNGYILDMISQKKYLIKKGTDYHPTFVKTNTLDR